MLAVQDSKLERRGLLSDRQRIGIATMPRHEQRRASSRTSVGMRWGSPRFACWGESYPGYPCISPTSRMLQHGLRGIDSMIFARHAICGGERVGCVEGFCRISSPAEERLEETKLAHGPSSIPISHLGGNPICPCAHLCAHYSLTR